MKNDGYHGRDGHTHCGNQSCCWGPAGSRKGAPKKRPNKRFVAQSQGDLQAVWNVLDTKTHVYRKFALTGEGARAACIELAKRLNKDRRYR